MAHCAENADDTVFATAQQAELQMETAWAARDADRGRLLAVADCALMLWPVLRDAVKSDNQHAIEIIHATAPQTLNACIRINAEQCLLDCYCANYNENTKEWERCHWDDGPHCGCEHFFESLQEEDESGDSDSDASDYDKDSIPARMRCFWHDGYLLELAGRHCSPPTLLFLLDLCMRARVRDRPNTWTTSCLWELIEHRDFDEILAVVTHATMRKNNFMVCVPTNMFMDVTKRFAGRGNAVLNALDQYFGCRHEQQLLSQRWRVLRDKTDDGAVDIHMGPYDAPTCLCCGQPWKHPPRAPCVGPRPPPLEPRLSKPMCDLLWAVRKSHSHWEWFTGL